MPGKDSAGNVYPSWVFPPQPSTEVVDYHKIREIIREEIARALMVPAEYWEIARDSSPQESGLFIPPSAQRKEITE